MIARSVWWVLLALAAVLVVVVQADRQALKDPAAIAVVPAPLRAVAQQRLTETTLVTGRVDDRALAGARHLVRVRPIPAHNLLLYAQAAQLSGDGAAVLAPLELAAARGWREPGLQAMAGRAALLSGDEAGAVSRIAALMATGRATAEMSQLLAGVMHSEAGRVEVAALLGRPGHYTSSIWRHLGEAGSPDQVLDVAAMAAAQGAELDCDDMRFVATGWTHQHHESQGNRLLALGCPARR
ncbi:MAG: hypothetical protein ABIT10_03295 [Alteraurantiacibacter sp.]